MGQEVTLLIDGDVVAFTAASAAQHIHEDGFGFVQPFANRHEGEAIADNIIIGLEQLFSATHFKVVLTDPVENWRRGIWSAYKQNRAKNFRPLLLDKLKDYLRAKYGAFHWDSLEADDVLGILSTAPGEDKRILIGKDKDYLTVPGFYHRLRDLDAKGKPVVKEVTPWEAQRYHLLQTLMGDQVDGYPGCPGIGAKRANELLDNPVLLTPQAGVKTRGVNKGESTTKWVAEPTRNLWAMVVSHYRKGMDAGPQEAEKAALVSARLAYILHHEDYDRETQSIRLWTPEKLRQA